jgi:adenylate cyclase
MQEQHRQERRLAAIMFTDLVAFSALSQRDEALALQVLEGHRVLVRNAVKSHGGTEVKNTGDGFLLTFPSALEAVRCAVAVQTAIAAHNEEPTAGHEFKVRIGIHVGDVVMRDGDIVGDGVNIAARIEPLAPAGGICITGPVWDQIRNKLKERVVPIGRPDLKNIEVPVEVYRVLLPWEDAPAVRNPARSKRLSLTAVGAAAILIPLVGGFAVWKGGAAPQKSVPTIAQRVLRSVAVLPLQNRSSDPEQAYFADGITDSLTTELAHVGALKVTSFQSVQRYKGEARKSMAEIARELKVDAVVRGAVQKSGDSIMINAELVDAASEHVIWGRAFTKQARDLLTVQNEIVLAVADAVKIELSAGEKKRFAASRPVNPSAMGHFYRGRAAFGLGSEKGFRDAIQHYNAAIELDPDLAPAYAGIADAYAALSSFFIPPKEAMPKAEAAARKALALDPDSAEAHSALGYILGFYHWKLDEAELEMKRALDLKPSYSTAFQNYGLLLAAAGRREESIANLRQALSLEPTSAIASASLEWALFLAGKYDEAIAQSKATLAIEPSLAMSYSQSGMAHMYKGNSAEGLKLLKAGYEKEANSLTATFYAVGLAKTGKREESSRVLDKFIKDSKDQYVCAYEIASAFEGNGNRAMALKWLERGHEDRCDCLLWSNTEPWMYSILKDPKFAAILAEAGLSR